MLDTKVIEWLIATGGITTRYRVYKELLHDETEAKKNEKDLLEDDCVQKWLILLKPETPPQHWSMHHGSFDFCFENAMPKTLQLGLHADIEQVKDAVGFYLQSIKDSIKQTAEKGVFFRNDFKTVLAANFLINAGFKYDFIIDFLLKSLDEAYRFVEFNNYDLYISDEERRKLTGIPRNWVNSKFLKPELFHSGICFPLIYDIIGMHKLYELCNSDIDNKIDKIIEYISNDEFHNKISDGYGIIIEPKDHTPGHAAYHGMGWDPKYPGWYNIQEYMEAGGAPRVLFFTQFISKYPVARRTKWFTELFNYLDEYKTECGTYIFPVKWLKESTGYAVGGNHLSFGENRRNKHWCEIESTLYMQLLKYSVL